MSTLNIIKEFPILRAPLDLGEYHPDLEGNSVEVWLNLSDDFQERWRAYNAALAAHIEEAKAKRAKTKETLVIDMTIALNLTRAELFAELWNLNADDVTALFNKTEAVGLLAWMRRRTWEIIGEYSTGRGEPGGG